MYIQPLISLKVWHWRGSLILVHATMTDTLYVQKFVDICASRAAIARY